MQLLKCIVDDITVDVSYQQMGGIRTVVFLEEMDRLVDGHLPHPPRPDNVPALWRRPVLFKRAIILVKAWCYYQARVLGAHHSLLSTYALEVLVLYVITHCHERANTPLSVLLLFLRTFGAFDWENSAVSLFGPVSLLALKARRPKKALPAARACHLLPLRVLKNACP